MQDLPRPVSIPGIIATLLIVVLATMMSTALTASLFYEGWGQPIPYLFGYVAPALSLILLGLLALRWPAIGGTLLLVAAAGAGGWWLFRQIDRQVAPLSALLVTLLIMVGPAVVAALLFFLEARRRTLLRRQGAIPSHRWLRRHWGEVLLIVAPAVAVAVISAQQLPALLARHDDGLRGARLIVGNGVTLIWAPDGPGWNWTASDASATWASLMRHGTASVELCAHLNEEGTALLPGPAGIWRMPTADEIMRSLTRGGVNAGCVWDGRSGHAACRTAPDKETPLWAPDQAPIYYWSSHGPDPNTAFAVNYTGGISVLPRTRPARAIGFRCVKAPPRVG